MSTSPGLALSGVGKELGGRTIINDLDLDVPKGELVCLLGPSGCGKSTTLRIISGFLLPDLGSVNISGREITELPPERRPTAMVFQNYALWPHMTVYDNIAYPLKLRKMSKTKIHEQVAEMLDLVNLGHHMTSRPAQISGGEQQRVALARALVQRPEVLLLDEPLSNLDAKLRVRVREDIHTIQRQLGITTVLVTHDQDEALSISDRVAVMNTGRIEQYSTPSELYRRPATRFVGDFVGAMNTFTGEIHQAGDAAVVTVGGAKIDIDDATVADGGTHTIGVRPENVIMTSPRDGCVATVSRVIPRGHFNEVEVTVTGASQEAATSLRAYSDNAPGTGIEPGTDVGLRIRTALIYEGEQLLT